MRIIGDLRWDKYFSKRDWETRFPGCLENPHSFSSTTLEPIGKYVRSQGFNFDYDKSPNPKCSFSVGGLDFSLYRVELVPDPTGKRKYRTAYIVLLMTREDQKRAFDSVISNKYATTDSGHCSKYTCISSLIFSPTPYTTSILDSVKVDPSAF